MKNNNRIIRQKELSELLGVSISTLYRMQNRGEIPPSKLISKNIVGWQQSDIDKWLEEIPQRKIIRDQ